MQQVLDAVDGLGSWRTKDITKNSDVSISERQVREHLNTLECGHLTREAEGRGYVWRDDGLHRINEHGEVEIDVIDTDMIAEVSRMSIYTWKFRNLDYDLASADEPATGTSEFDSQPTVKGVNHSLCHQEQNNK